MSNSDPITPLTPAEQAFVNTINTQWTRDQVLTALKADLQTAIEIELATVPIYLNAYYSIVRNSTSGEEITPLEVFANKAGGVIMSVAVEEMLHMSLSSNVLFALGQMPVLYGSAPKQYPTGLPYHNPQGPVGPVGKTAVLIPQARLNFLQLWHFLQIEYPEPWNTLPLDRKWNTIGQFYSYIRCLIYCKWLTDADFQNGAAASAIQPYNYSPNNIDTVYPTGKFDPWKPAPPVPTPPWAKPDKYPSGSQATVYTDAPDSHAGPDELITVSSRKDAAEAIDTICDQGEGYPIPGVGPGPDDDPSKSEESHYMKFLTLQAQYAEYVGTREQLPPQPPPPPPQQPTIHDADLLKAQLVINFPDNPTTAGYPVAFQPIAAFCSACFQYMLIMSETIYKVPPSQQKLFFNEGLHRSMIWVLDKYIRTIRDIPLGNGQFMSPVFENVDLGPRATSFQKLTQLGAAAITAASKYQQGDPLYSVMQNVIYYVCVATPQPNPPYSGRTLPDVGPYWAS
jgi:hypothetical protein